MGNFVSRLKSKRKNYDYPLCDWCTVCEKTGVMGSGVCTCPNTVGRCSCSPRAAPSPSCVFYSPRIHALWDGKRTEEQTTRDHWTGIKAKSEAEVKRVGEDNRQYFDEVLAKHPEWGCLFTRFEDLKLGAKIGEGAQAEIFEVTSWRYKDLEMGAEIREGGHAEGKILEARSQRYTSGSHRRPNVLGELLHFPDGVELVAKVWKEGVSLRDLERQWPSQMLSKVCLRDSKWPFMNIHGGAFIRHGEFKHRFAFIMQKQLGDLRSSIDHRMLNLLNNHSHGPPFRNINQVISVLLGVLVDLKELHKVGIVHKDVKASNVLLGAFLGSPFSCLIDFECSVGIVGTGFWRAPEILEQLDNGVPGHEVKFTKKADVYSFGMMCYEMTTGCIPFYDYPQSDYSIVLSGNRPNLPNALSPKLRKLILDCWKHDPKCRPTIQNIYNRVRTF